MELSDLRFGHAPLPPRGPGYDPAADAFALIAPGTPSPATTPIPGSQDFDSLRPGQRFVVRVPAAWNGDLVVCGTPAMRSECASDATLGDFLLARGYAFAASNKGIPYNGIIEPADAGVARADAYLIPFDLPGVPKNTGAIRLGALSPQAADVAAWHADLATLIVTVKERLRTVRGRAPRRTYAVGLSLGGGQVRWLLERHPELVDGGVEWAAVLWRPEQNVLTSLPTFLRYMPAYLAGGGNAAAARDAIVAAGFPADRRGSLPEHRSLWDDHYSFAPYYADLTTFAFAKLLDPEAGALDTLESRAAYAPSAPARARIDGFAHTGALERPLLAVVGDSDVFITPQHNAAPYLEAVRAAGCGARYEQYIVAGGTHVDAYAAFGYRLQPQLPFVWRAFERLVAVVEGGLPLRGDGRTQLVRTPAEIR
ncbi:MAG: alpha/beta hydrolase [Candidatus Eremiobacteraeota bacterium]|nr:alpha/beta hydrolase [Candidatus Eremiobacteraeota bacterium]